MLKAGEAELSTEIVLEIISFLDVVSTFHLSMTSRLLHHLIIVKYARSIWTEKEIVRGLMAPDLMKPSEIIRSCTIPYKIQHSIHLEETLPARAREFQLDMVTEDMIRGLDGAARTLGPITQSSTDLYDLFLCPGGRWLIGLASVDHSMSPTLGSLFLLLWDLNDIATRNPASIAPVAWSLCSYPVNMDQSQRKPWMGVHSSPHRHSNEIFVFAVYADSTNVWQYELRKLSWDCHGRFKFLKTPYCCWTDESTTPRIDVEAFRIQVGGNGIVLLWRLESFLIWDAESGAKVLEKALTLDGLGVGAPSEPGLTLRSRFIWLEADQLRVWYETISPGEDFKPPVSQVVSRDIATLFSSSNPSDYTRHPTTPIYIVRNFHLLVEDLSYVACRLGHRYMSDWVHWDVAGNTGHLVGINGVDLGTRMITQLPGELQGLQGSDTPFEGGLDARSGPPREWPIFCSAIESGGNDSMTILPNIPIKSSQSSNTSPKVIANEGDAKWPAVLSTRRVMKCPVGRDRMTIDVSLADLGSASRKMLGAYFRPAKTHITTDLSVWDWGEVHTEGHSRQTIVRGPLCFHSGRVVVSQKREKGDGFQWIHALVELDV